MLGIGMAIAAASMAVVTPQRLGGKRYKQEAETPKAANDPNISRQVRRAQERKANKKNRRT